MPKLQNLLDGKSVQRVRAEMAVNLMAFGGIDPPIMPNPNAMRRAKYTADCPTVGPFAAVTFLNKKYPKSLHSIG